MRLLVTSDLHFDHPRSRALAEQAADELTALGAAGVYDVLLVVGDTATSRGDALEHGLSRIRFAGPKLLTFGNHELWSTDGDAMALYEDILPRRVASLGWHCLDQMHFVSGDTAIVGTVGWYDYSFAPPHLGIPRRFYEAKVAPGSARADPQLSHLFDDITDIAPEAMDIYARWNDSRFIRWSHTDVSFTELLLARLEAQLESVRSARQVVAAVHHLPLRELLPPLSTHAWDFAKAYLGSPRFGELLMRYPNVTHVFSGHSHFPGRADLGSTRFQTTGSGYRQKLWQVIDLAERSPPDLA